MNILKFTYIRIFLQHIKLLSNITRETLKMMTKIKNKRSITSSGKKTFLLLSPRQAVKKIPERSASFRHFTISFHRVSNKLGGKRNKRSKLRHRGKRANLHKQTKLKNLSPN